ncbi:GFA family protein [Pararhodospirillum oryzae]|uniref:Aldehyde-activating protein n=1 Tax=Pararhodospirillum oryzae TaxID=478448 RepID=A0A512HBW8_9PROT|nr:GFA family protein [Pararhodospirillum oryzae]GEO82947.1 aldehyde-activating protein [Pararhodospirillum oryzae]
MSSSIYGSCLCEIVKFHITGEFDKFFACHCSRCRKDTGSAFAANLFSTTAELTWTAGKDQVKTFRVPDSRHEKSFCMTCGSALPTVQMNGRLLIVPAGSLDSPIGIHPTAHICYASRAEWTDALEALERLDGLPISSAKTSPPTRGAT